MNDIAKGQETDTDPQESGASNDEEAIRFLKLLRPEGPWCLCAIYLADSERVGGDKGATATLVTAKAAEARAWIRERNGRANLHFIINGLDWGQVREKPSANLLTSFDYAHVDIDCDKAAREGIPLLDAIAKGKAAAVERLQAFDSPGPPFAIIDTGGGLQALWRISAAMPLASEGDIDDAKSINRALVDTLGGDAACANPVHLLRLPGTVNIPGKAKRKRGRVPAPARLLWTDGDSRSWPADAFPRAQAEGSEAADFDIEPEAIGDLAELESFALSDRLLRIIETGRNGEEVLERDDSRSAWAFLAAKLMLQSGVPAAVAAGVLLNRQFGISAKALDCPDPAREAVRTVANARMSLQDWEERQRCEAIEVLADEPLEGEPLEGEPTLEDEKPHRWHLWEVSELGNLPPIQWLVEGMLPERGLAQIYGPTKSHKTFATLAMALSVATGQDFYGIPTKRGRVLYVIGEGQSDIYDRVLAWCLTNEVDVEDLRGQFRVVISPVLLDGEEVAAFTKLTASEGPFDLAIFDTVNRCMEGDENDTRSMTQFVKGCDHIRETFGCAVLVVHHTGWGGQRARGSSVLIAAVDASIQVKLIDEATSRDTRLLVEHIRAAPPGKELFLAPQSVVTSAEGDSLRSSIILRLIDEPPIVSAKDAQRMKREVAKDDLLLQIARERPKQQKDLISDQPYRSQATVSAFVKELREEGLLEGKSLTASGEGLERMHVIDPGLAERFEADLASTEGTE